ncbi:MAG: RNA polymerase sporulation sigma factor SigF [Defluviitaleaceae bacterium]|nr:RNA polymerase sporulation sigma factor SigF [Defluviitaleaceae bacterium]
MDKPNESEEAVVSNMNEIDETKELILKAQNGDKEALDMLVNKNLGLIWSVVKKFTNRGYEPDDLFQIGAIGLIKCIQKFDMGFEVKFSTYAVPMIIGEIKRFLRDDGLIKISRPLKELSRKAKYLAEELQQKTGKPPTLLELAEKLEVDVDELSVALDSSREVESIYQAVYQGDGNPVFLIDKIEQNDDEESKNVDIITLKEILKNLSPKEQQIINMRYFDDKTQTETAKEIGISQVQVSRIEKKVLSTLKNQLL